MAASRNTGCRSSRGRRARSLRDVSSYAGGVRAGLGGARGEAIRFGGRDRALGVGPQHEPAEQRRRLARRVRNRLLAVPTPTTELHVQRPVEVVADDLQVAGAPDPALHAEPPALLEEAEFIDAEVSPAYAELAPGGLRRHQERRGEAMREALILLRVAAALHDKVPQLVRGVEAQAVGRRLRVEDENRRRSGPAGEAVESPRLRPSEHRPATFLDQANEVVDGAVAEVPAHAQRRGRVVAIREVAHGDRAGEVVPLVEVEHRSQAELALQALGRDGGDSLLASLTELRELAKRLPADVDRGFSQ